jgi:hypothetical protein
MLRRNAHGGWPFFLQKVRGQQRPADLAPSSFDSLDYDYV